MAAGLAWFETYLPRTLVRQLIQRSDRRDVASEEREITVMFTDIVDSSSFAGRLNRLALAEFLNHHFALVGGSVDKSGGTIDKYTGDGVMAFWGAPIEQPNHARRACRAARRIAARIAVDNEARRQAGLPIVRVRVGIHTGMALVGNIGAPGRINYTPLGETVILAERIQRMAKSVDRGDEVTVLISGATCAAIGGSFPCDSVGVRRLDGHAAPVALYRLAF
jgi:class 3 adenylate cyclase